ncbi:MAG: Nif11-like leader peptide family RiPP precursor [Anaerolineae bacterium]|nr:Nif11-like leader peptide family RiPP precursor [Anaerolineae bacterium]
MSRENLIKLLETTASNASLKKQLLNKNYEEIKSVAQVHGFDLGDLTEEEANRTIDVLAGTISDELSDEELELVAGGGSGKMFNIEQIKRNSSQGSSKPGCGYICACNTDY